MRRTTFAIVSAAVLMFVALGVQAGGRKEAGGTSPSGTAVDEITIQMWAGPESTAMLEVVNDWNSRYTDQTGIKVSLVTLGRVGYPEKVTSQLTSGVDKPDLIQDYSFHVGSVGTYLEPLEHFFSGPQFSSPDGTTYKKDTMIQTSLQAGEVDGKLVAVPTDISWWVMMYRKDLMDLKTNPIETWDDMVQRAKQFTKSYNPNSPTLYGTDTTGKLVFHISFPFLQILWSNGGSMFKSGTWEPAFDSAAALKAAKTLSDLGKAKVMPPDFENGEFPEVAAAFQNKQVAFAPYWNAMYPMLTDQKQSPEIYDKIGITVVPGSRQPDGTIKRAVYFHTLVLGMNKASKHKEKAFKFLAYATFGDGALTYAKNGGAPPLYSVFTGPSAKEPFLSGGDMIAKYGRAMPAFPDLQAFLEVMKEYQQKLLLGQDYQRTMQDLQKATTDFMKQRGYIK